MKEIMAGYQHALRRSLRMIGGTTGSSKLVEATVGEGSAFAGTTVSAAPWPTGSFALSIDRNSQLMTPTPHTELLPGDVVVAVVPASHDGELRRLFGASTTG